MPLGAYKLNSISRYLAPSGPTLPAVYTLTNAISSVRSSFGGDGFSQNDWQGIFNTNYGVFVITWLNSAGTVFYVAPGVVDLTNGTIAMGSTVTIGNNNSAAVHGFAVAAKKGSNFGLLGGPIWTGSAWSGRYYGYTLSNLSTVTTSNLPTLTLSSALTDTNSSNFFAGNMAYAGNDRFVFVNRYGPGDLSMSHFISYAGSGTPSYFYNNFSKYGTSRSSGHTISFTSNLSSTLASSFSNTIGNNANFTDLYVSCSSSSAEADFKDDDRLDCSPSAPISGASFTCAKAYDTNGTWIGISGLYSGQEYQKLVAEKVTALSSSSVTVTSGSVASITPTSRRLAAMHELDPTQGIVRGVTSDTGTYLVDISVNSSTLAVTFGTPYQVSASRLYSGENIKNLKDATHGEWTMLNQISSGNLNVTMIKVAE